MLNTARVSFPTDATFVKTSEDENVPGPDPSTAFFAPREAWAEKKEEGKTKDAAAAEKDLTTLLESFVENAGRVLQVP